MNDVIPPAEHRCWLHLSSSASPGIQTRQLGLQLLFKRLQGESLSAAAKAREVHAFFLKYQKILGPEIAQLSSL